MIKLKSLLNEFVTPSDFMKSLKRAEKETGKKGKIPSGTIKLCNEVKKAGFNKLDYLGKPGKARETNKPMYQYYAYIQGWGHSDFKNPSDWWQKGAKKDPILKWFRDNNHSAFDYDFLLKAVNSDMQANQIIGNIRPGSKDVEPAYYLVKSYYNSFGSNRNTYVHDQVVNKVDWWLKKNKVKTS